MVKKLGIALGVLILLLLLVMGFFAFIYQGARSTLEDGPIQVDEALVKRGEYLANAGDCSACHTAPDGETFAGGLAIVSPVGTIYSTNITPDRSGIGEYTLSDFDNALRHGVRKNGDSLYPAMPFPSFSVVTDDDVRALFAYFMHGVAPVARENQATDIPWPLSMRWPLAAWRMLFSDDDGPFEAASDDPQIARGAYLVQGLGHCGSCHTPRSAWTLGEQAYLDDDHRLYLAGGTSPIDGWIAINLRGDPLSGLGGVSEDELFDLLRTGRSDNSAVFGGMADVVNHSLQYLNDEDLRAIARYLKTLAPVNADEQPFSYDPAVADALKRGDVSLPGAQTYLDNCATCHRSDGQGYAQVFPALAGNPVVHSGNAVSLINLVLKGHELQGTRQAVTAFTMPGFSWRLSDAEVAELVTFIRSAWGNQGSAVQAAEVAALRDKLPATADDNGH